MSLLFLTKSATVSIFLNWITLFVFSCIEYYKFDASGTHFVVTDMMMIGNASDMTKFTYINIMPILVINLLILIAYNTVVFLLNIKIKYRFAKSFLIGLCSISALIGFIAFPSVSLKVYGLFDMQDSKSANSFAENEKFEDLNFISYFIESATGLFTYAPKEPKNYSKETMHQVTAKDNAETIQNIKDISEITKTEKINIIYIMSESFADFRNLDPLDHSLNSNYKNFDMMRREGFGGTCIVPTFGGYTSRTEFEIIFGLPLKSIGTPAMPNNKLKRFDKSEIFTIADYYKLNGYSTSYIHPFSRTFYNRDEIYCKYGFDNMIFDDNMTVETDNFGKYISDKTAFAQIVDVIKNTDESDYIVATTMQNHVPYVEDKNGATGEEEYNYYLQGVGETDSALKYLRSELLKIYREYGEKCIVIFLGDHYPFFITDGNKYNSWGINADNCTELYKQNYFIWANYDFDFDKILSQYNLDKEISAFYLPNIIAAACGINKGHIMEAILEQVNSTPVYTQFYDNSISNDILDLLTYDLILGEKFALPVIANESDG